MKISEFFYGRKGQVVEEFTDCLETYASYLCEPQAEAVGKMAGTMAMFAKEGSNAVVAVLANDTEEAGKYETAAWSIYAMAMEDVKAYGTEDIPGSDALGLLAYCINRFASAYSAELKRMKAEAAEARAVEEYDEDKEEFWAKKLKED